MSAARFEEHLRSKLGERFLRAIAPQAAGDQPPSGYELDFQAVKSHSGDAGLLELVKELSVASVVPKGLTEAVLASLSLPLARSGTVVQTLGGADSRSGVLETLTVPPHVFVLALSASDAGLPVPKGSGLSPSYMLSQGRPLQACARFRAAGVSREDAALLIRQVGIRYFAEPAVVAACTLCLHLLGMSSDVLRVDCEALAYIVGSTAVAVEAGSCCRHIPWHWDERPQHVRSSSLFFCQSRGLGGSTSRPCRRGGSPVAWPSRSRQHGRAYQGSQHAVGAVDAFDLVLQGTLASFISGPLARARP